MVRTVGQVNPIYTALPDGSSVPFVYFGYPQVHEDDSERAVRAGLR
jgi:hypothetical protein